MSVGCTQEQAIPATDQRKRQPTAAEAHAAFIAKHGKPVRIAAKTPGNVAQLICPDGAEMGNEGSLYEPPAGRRGQLQKIILYRRELFRRATAAFEELRGRLTTATKETGPALNPHMTVGNLERLKQLKQECFECWKELQRAETELAGLTKPESRDDLLKAEVARQKAESDQKRAEFLKELEAITLTPCTATAEELSGIDLARAGVSVTKPEDFDQAAADRINAWLPE